MHDIDMDLIEPKIIKTQDENGEIHNFELIDIINFENQDYGLLVYLDDDEEKEDKDEDDEDDEEIIIMKLSKVDDAYSFETIEDDEEFNKIVSYLETQGDLEEDDDEEE